MKINLKKYLFLFFLALLILPLILKILKVEILPLKGAISQAENIKVNTKNWFSGDYQSRKEGYINESFGSRSFFIRLNNQIAYTFYNQAKANGVVIGKNNFLFEEGYINAYYGRDFIGYDSINNRLRKFKYIQDTLEKLGKNIMIVFAAGKGSFYPEYFPDYLKGEKGQTNYNAYVKIAGELDINYIDFNKYFVDNKFKSKYPLYPQYGIHWSVYGSCLVADSIIKYIEHKRRIDMPEFVCRKIKIARPKETDYDIGDGMNLLFNMRSFKMAYPSIQIVSDSNNVKPSLLVISDSFYWLMYGSGFTEAFKNQQFWYYFKNIHPNINRDELLSDHDYIKDQILKTDVVILMASEVTISGLGWGFIEQVYNIFDGQRVEYERKIQAIIRVIKNDKKWFNLVQEKAKYHKINIDSMILIDAIWIYQQ